MLLIKFHASGKFFVPSRIPNLFELCFKTLSQKKIPKTPENRENHYDCYKNWLFYSIWDW